MRPTMEMTFVTVAAATRVRTADGPAIEAAARTLAGGGLVAFPTETVYGLGADAGNARAVARLYEAKGRPAFNPLISHVADVAAARRLAWFDAAAKSLARSFWPGPLTLVLPKAQNCPVADLATAGLDTIAVRVPDHPVAHAILAAFGRPVVAPSANFSGHVSPTTAQHVLADLRGRIDLVIDGGATRLGLESTIVACLGERAILLRLGALTRATIEHALGHELTEEPQPVTRARAGTAPSAPGAARRASATAATMTNAAPTAPGQLVSHYAPRAALRLNAQSVAADEALLAFGPNLAAGAERTALTLNLSHGGDLIEAAANLFSHLRALDASGVATIAAMPVPEEGLGETINDRLRRAAAPR